MLILAYLLKIKHITFVTTIYILIIDGKTKSNYICDIYINS